jgi:hypothetical protein
MHVAELWRYPVKSMAAERLREVRLTPLGLEGDRVVHVEGARGRVVTARTHPKLLGHHAVLGAQGEPLVDGRAWTDPSVTADIERIVGAGARLVRDDGVGRFDILPLLIATDGAIAAFGYDGRRLRPNLVIGGVRGLDERTWEGKGLRIGDVLIALADLRGRCVMTTFDPDTLAQDHGVLRSIVDRFDGRLALNATVVRAGRVGEGDRVDLVESPVGLDSRTGSHSRCWRALSRLPHRTPHRLTPPLPLKSCSREVVDTAPSGVTMVLRSLTTICVERDMRRTAPDLLLVSEAANGGRNESAAV